MQRLWLVLISPLIALIARDSLCHPMSVCSWECARGARTSTNVHAPMFCGSSCTHLMVCAFGYCATSAASWSCPHAHPDEQRRTRPRHQHALNADVCRHKLIITPTMAFLHLSPSLSHTPHSPHVLRRTCSKGKGDSSSTRTMATLAPSFLVALHPQTHMTRTAAPPHGSHPRVRTKGRVQGHTTALPRSRVHATSVLLTVSLCHSMCMRLFSLSMHVRHGQICGAQHTAV
jgi:hypothetical protein